MGTRFRTYDLAVTFYRNSRSIVLPGYVKHQFNRAALSIALNLREGRGRRTRRDQLHFFHIALGSTRECQSVQELHPEAFGPQLSQNARSACRFAIPPYQEGSMSSDTAYQQRSRTATPQHGCQIHCSEV